jgi:hypothetical protein
MEALGLRRIYLPRYLCSSVFEACEDAGLEMEPYEVGTDFLPRTPLPDASDAAFYLVNYYGQLDNATIANLAAQLSHPIVDNTHALFQAPVEHVPTIYSIRKFLGVPDGAYLAFDGELALDGQDFSSGRMRHILGRFEESASPYYQDMLATSETFRHTRPLAMSPLTRNLLRAIDYDRVRSRREANFSLLHARLGQLNRLSPRTPEGPFCYPLLVSDGELFRRELAKQRIYVPTYWRCAIDALPQDAVEHDLAANIVALPCDQRYEEDDMRRVADAVLAIAADAGKGDA